RLFGQPSHVRHARTILADEVHLLRQAYARDDASALPDALRRSSLAAILLDGPEPFTHEEVCDELFVFTVASLESTSAAFGARLREEVVRLTSGHDPFLTFEQMQPASAPYLDAVYRECLRLAYIAPAFTRTTTRPINAGALYVPAHATVLFPIAVLQRDTRIWGSDADAFRPERWLDTPPTTRQAYLRAMYHFGGGDRQCYGQRQATMQLKLFLAVIAFYFRLDALPAHLHTDALEQCGFLSRSACPWAIPVPLSAATPYNKQA
ncbi:cytochrome P450, partial [Syncephalis pseudoplumigaleata]